MSRTRRLAVLVGGATCFALAVAYLAAHPNHSWREATGEPEHHSVAIEVEPVRTE